MCLLTLTLFLPSWLENEARECLAPSFLHVLGVSRKKGGLGQTGNCRNDSKACLQSFVHSVVSDLQPRSTREK